MAIARRKSAKGGRSARAKSPTWQEYAAPTEASPQLVSLTAENIAATTGTVAASTPASAPPPPPPQPPPGGAPPSGETGGRGALFAEINARRMD